MVHILFVQKEYIIRMTFEYAVCFDIVEKWDS